MASCKVKIALPLLGAICLFANASFAQAPKSSQDVVTACAETAMPAGSALHVEVQDEYGLYRAGETVMVSDPKGLPLVTLHCEGPWANFRLAPGNYRVFAFIGDQVSPEMAVDVTPAGTSVTLKLEPPPVQPAEPEVTLDDRIILPPPPNEAAENLDPNAPAPSPQP